jgi:predicted alpha/beta hydrolase family esterase
MTSRGGTVKLRGAAGALGAFLLAWSCAVHGPLLSDDDFTLERLQTIVLHKRPVELHLARLRGAPSGAPLVLYVTGDGGWRGADPLVFRTLVQWGYPSAGMEARGYLDHLGDLDERATPRRLARDYASILARARHELGLAPATPVVLVGFSRGAGLAVLAAGQPSLRAAVMGVVAVALTDEEDEVRLDPEAAATLPPPADTINPYHLLPRLGSLPVAVIQSTHDRYVAAAAARRLFGADTPTRRLLAIESDGHTFAGARDSLLEALRASLRWIAGTPP